MKTRFTIYQKLKVYLHHDKDMTKRTETKGVIHNVEN